MMPKAKQEFGSIEYVALSVIETNYETWDEIRNKKAFYHFNRNYLFFELDPNLVELLPWSREREA